METGIHNTSEIGRLRKVMLHRPGQELENLMPEYLEHIGKRCTGAAQVPHVLACHCGADRPAGERQD